ncbi:hypothetical protein G7Z17_g6192 [Cylindrodendrum hubeiense]|uniref:Zn(2)-C6 fungal-type domain-containing protein n=1 Tax=Cylindrodendrum hubeiense TaxID=595255 RepID=A0A9P5LH28_9HYPO|nr:hypothetical protein G7Z17_g6192 [Cylindrodendrum hubeiense]
MCRSPPPLASPSTPGNVSADAAVTGKRPQTLARRACDACRARRRKCVFAEGVPHRSLRRRLKTRLKAMPSVTIV